ncbi:MAG: hypothetical protein LUG99_14885 [Lachnospiraceae bacterium]|nr:hypothetical protein [Lachnospiraceae bacterium]
MKRNFLKRSLALVIAASMTLSSVPTSLVFAEEYTDEAVVLEDDVVLDEDASEEEAAAEDSEEEASDDGISIASVEEVDTADVPAEVAVDDTADVPETVADTPGTVTAEFDADEKLLTWTADTAADYYEISITDGTYVYGYSGYIKEYDDLYYYISSSLYAYTVDSDGNFALAEDSDGDYIYGLSASTTYTIKVRAVNVNSSDSSDVAYGEWSNEVTYTTDALVTSLDKVSSIELDEDILTYTYLETYDAIQMKVVDTSTGYVYTSGYGTDTDADGNVTLVLDNSYVRTTNNSYINLANYYEELKSYYIENNSVTYRKDSDGNPLSAFQLNTTYTINIRARYYNGSEYIYGDWSDDITYTPVEATAPSETTKLTYDGEDGSGYLSWNYVDCDAYEIELTDASGNTYYRSYNTTSNDDGTYTHTGIGASTTETSYYAGNLKSLYYRTVTDNTTSYGYTTTRASFDAGTKWYVRVRPYNVSKDDSKETPDNRIYADWSNSVTITIPEETEEETETEDTSKPDQVSGVVAYATTSTKKITWNEVENADYYLVAITDADGNAYYSSYDYTNKKWNYYKPSVSLNSSTGVVTWSVSSATIYTYQLVDDEYIAKVDAETGEKLKAFTAGETYSVSVCAVNTYTDSTTGETVTVLGDWSAAVTYAEAAESTIGSSATPAQVTGLLVTDNAEDNYYGTSTAELHWSYVDDDIDHYEILVKDSAGNEYVSTIDPEQRLKGVIEPIYYSVSVSGLDNSYYPAVTLSALTGMRSYYKVDGYSIAYLKDEDGETITTFQDGETYTFQVRAVNVDEDGNEYPGAWSSSVSYTAGTVTAISDLAYVSEDDYYYYFSYSAEVANNATYIYYQIASDTAFTALSRMTTNWVGYGLDNSYDSYKLRVSKSAYDLTVGTTYYIRAVFSTGSTPDDDEVAELNPSVASFVVTEEEETTPTPKTITGLYLYNYSASDSYVYFRFDPVLDDEDDEEDQVQDYYELQYAMSASAEDADWVTFYSGTSTSPYYYKYNLDDGTYYVRARAYVYVTDEDGNTEKSYGTASNTVSFTVSRATTSISNLKLAEQYNDTYYFTFSGTPRDVEQVQYWVSTSSTFETSTRKITNISYTGNNYRFSIPYTDLTPGQTYYIRARIVNEKTANGTTEYSGFTNTVTITATMPTITVTTQNVTSTTITLAMNYSSNDDYLTGYQVQKKIGSSYKTIAKTTDNTVKDTKLSKDTTYTYRVRPYYYNTETGTTTTGSWVYIQTMTWGGTLTLKTTATSKTKVKLSWNKITGASGYEIYRRVTSTGATTVTAGVYNAYDKDVLVKTIKKASTTKYTDKNLNSNLSYTYYVRAYKTINGKKYYITSNEKTMDMNYLNFGSSVEYYYTSAGNVKVTWNRVYTASGYVVEKKNAATGQWETYKTLGKKKSTVTLPATSNFDGVKYRIRAYNGIKYSTSSDTITVYPQITAPTGVKATANATTGAITVTWNAVSGAAYYEVYRTTSSSYVVYNATTKKYTLPSDATKLSVYKANAATVSGYELDEDDLTATTITDAPIVYTYNGVETTYYEGPAAGVKYYYYVVAYANDSYIYSDNTTGSASAVSAAASATITSVTVKKPTLKSAKATSGKVTLTWKKVSGAAGYEIYRSTKKGSGYTLIGTVTKGSTKKYVDKTATKGKTYYYKIRAYKLNEAGAYKYSSYSAKKKVTAK